ncbi:uncharacterized protein LOC135197566 [Macrobrachium nipponense]|uniref:uncharacterized protein LOC135197566 n=1 Tax=Macrobrachium nipponense TaxID=159736 RepID=UPI0030C7E241
MRTKFLVLLLLTALQATNAFLSGASEIVSSIIEQVQDHLDGVSESSEGRFFGGGGGYGGCTDSFSVFGFLAFLLALLDLILDLQMNMAAGGGGAGGRSIRSPGGVHQASGRPPLTCQDNAELQQATSACYSMLRGFLNALASDDPECAERFLCEGAEEAAAAGPVGEVIASVASLNAGSWLQKVNATLFAGVTEAGESGAKSGGCAFRYSRCFGLPDAYRYPAVYRGPQLPSEAYQPILQEVMDAVKDALL